MKKTERHKDTKDIRNGKILESLQGSVDDLEQVDGAEGEKSGESDFFDPSAPMMKNKKFFFVLGLII